VQVDTCRQGWPNLVPMAGSKSLPPNHSLPITPSDYSLEPHSYFKRNGCFLSIFFHCALRSFLNSSVMMPVTSHISSKSFQERFLPLLPRNTGRHDDFVCHSINSLENSMQQNVAVTPKPKAIHFFQGIKRWMKRHNANMKSGYCQGKKVGYYFSA